MPWKPRRPRRAHYAPLAVPILDGFDMLGVGVTKGYELVNAGQIDTFLLGRRRYATLESLKRLATPADRQEGDAPIVGGTQLEEHCLNKKRRTVALKTTEKQHTPPERHALK